MILPTIFMCGSIFLEIAELEQGWGIPCNIHNTYSTSTTTTYLKWLLREKEIPADSWSRAQPEIGRDWVLVFVCAIIRIPSCVAILYFTWAVVTSCPQGLLSIIVWIDYNTWVSQVDLPRPITTHWVRVMKRSISLKLNWDLGFSKK